MDFGKESNILIKDETENSNINICLKSVCDISG